MYRDNEKALVLSSKINQKKADLKPNVPFSFPKHFFSLVSSFLALILLFSFSVIPYEFCHAVGTPTFWDSRVYPMGLVDEGSEEAGLKGRATEYLYQSTSEWTTQIADLEDGNFMMQTTPISLPGVPFPVQVTLTYNHYNAGIDIGLGKGCQWRFKIMHDGDLNLCKMGGELFQNCANRLKMNSIHPKRGNTAYDKSGRQKVSYRIAQAWTSYRKDCYPLGSTPQFRQYNFKRKERAISYERIQFDQS